MRKGLCLQWADDVSVSCASRMHFPRARVCVWMIQQLVQLQSVSAARAHSQLTGENKQTQGAFIVVFSAKLTVSQPVQVKTHVGDPVELGEAGQQQRRGRAAAAERRGEQRRVSASRLPVDFIRIYRDFHRPSSVSDALRAD